MLSLMALCYIARTQTEPIVTPYFQREALAIRSIAALTPSVKRFGVEELKVDLGATYQNPFDPSDVSLDAAVTSPKGVTYTIPGFLYLSFDRSLTDGKESLAKTGEPEWRVRICPFDVGEYKVVLTLHDETGTVTSKPFSFKADPSDAHGLIRVSPRNPRYFEYSDGSSFYPIGANVCWGNDPGTFSYDKWLPDYANVHANYMRVWLGPAWVTFAMEVSGKTQDGKGMGQFDLSNAWRLDRVVKQAQTLGLNMLLTIDSYNTLRAHGGYPAWDKAPENRDNGGPLRIWSEYWTNSQIDRFYKAKLRYLVARYSAFSNVMAWGFWNEIDISEDYSPDVVQAWLRRMGDALKSLDPYHHLVTSSLANSMGNRDLDLLPELDYVQTHSYNNPDVAGGVLYQQTRKAEWGKPHIVAEIGADASGPRADVDPEGMQIHDPLWMSLATGSSGGASPWWWDNLIASKNLYPLFGAATSFIKGIDWPGEDFKRADVQIDYKTKPKVPERKDLAFENGPVQWSAGDSNKPHFVTIAGGKATGDLPLPGIQHGVRNHPDWHNPVRFKVNLERPTRFEVTVGDVSGYGGAVLQISLDGDPVLTREFHAGENAEKGQSVSSFAGRFGIEVPKGDHAIVVEDIGNDWFMASYRFVDLVTRTGPALQGWAVEGNDVALAWVRQEGRTWRRVIIDKVKIPPVLPSVFELDGLAAGAWKAEVWDTWKGIPITEETTQVGINGRLRIDLPEVDKDVAVKLVKVPR